QLENMSTRLTEVAAGLRGLSLNDVLVSKLIVLDADGIAAVNTKVDFASVGAWNLSTHDLTVSSSTKAASAPTSGVGVIPVPEGSAVVWPLVGTSCTIYGTAGDSVLIALWSRPQPPMVAGVGAVIGGTP